VYSRNESISNLLISRYECGRNVLSPTVLIRQMFGGRKARLRDPRFGAPLSGLCRLRHARGAPRQHNRATSATTAASRRTPAGHHRVAAAPVLAKQIGAGHLGGAALPTNMPGKPDSPARPRRAPGSGELSPANEAREPSRPPPSLRWRICISRGRNGNDGRDRASFISGFAGIVRPSRKLVSGAQWPGDHRRWNQGSLPHQR
jgi:hypothetical protein